jgi:hypothetical protein
VRKRARESRRRSPIPTVASMSKVVSGAMRRGRKGRGAKRREGGSVQAAAVVEVLRRAVEEVLSAEAVSEVVRAEDAGTAKRPSVATTPSCARIAPKPRPAPPPRP